MGNITAQKKVSDQLKPYRIDPEISDNFIRGVEVMAVGKANDFPNAKGTWEENPRHYGDCKTTYQWSTDGSMAVGHNCDLSPGDSGGALLTPGENPALLGVHEADGAGAKGCQIPKGKTSGPSTDCWNDSSVAVNIQFLEALQQIKQEE